MEMLLAIIRVIEEEQDIHSETKFLEWQRNTKEELSKEEKTAKKEKHEKAATSLADRQKGNIDKLKEFARNLKSQKQLS